MFRTRVVSVLLALLLTTACVDEPLPLQSVASDMARAKEEVSVIYPGLNPVTGEPLSSIQEAIDAVMELTDCDGGSVEIAAGEYVERFHIPNLAAVVAQQLRPGCQLPSVRGAGAGVTRIVADYATPPLPVPPHINVGGTPFAEPFSGASGDDRFFRGGELCCMEIVRGRNAPLIAIGSVWTRGSAFRDIMVTGSWSKGLQATLVNELTVERNSLTGPMETAIEISFPPNSPDILPNGQPDISILDNNVVGAQEGIRTVFVQDAVIKGNAVDATKQCFFAGGSVDLRYDDNRCLNAQDPNGGNLRVLTSREIRWQGGCVSDAAALVTLGFDDTGWPDDISAPWVVLRFEVLGPARDILIKDVLTSHVAEVVSDCPGSPFRGPECDAAPDFGDRDVTIRSLVDDPGIDCAVFQHQGMAP